jgi:hypothetical protein
MIFLVNFGRGAGRWGGGGGGAINALAVSAGQGPRTRFWGTFEAPRFAEQAA